jgi:hypothetical protein
MFWIEPEGAGIRQHGKMLDSWTEKTEETWRKNLLQCPFIHLESHME